jgi:hypothetical protein
MFTSGQSMSPKCIALINDGMEHEGWLPPDIDLFLDMISKSLIIASIMGVTDPHRFLADTLQRHLL